MEEGQDISTDNSVAEENKQEKVPQEVARKEAFMAHFEEKHELAEKSEDPAASAEKQDEPAASAAKDESAQKPKETPKAAPEGYVRKEALDEERSRRKRLSQKLKDYETRLLELESKSGQSSATQSEDTAEEDMSDKERALIEENRMLKAAQLEREKAKEQETVQEKQARINKQVSEVDKELREQGYPGFRLGAQLVDQKLRALLQDEEIDFVDYQDPKMWKRVYLESIYADVAKEFGFATKQAITEKKNGAKELAAKAASIAGSKNEAKKKVDDEDEEFDARKDHEEAMKLRRDAAPKRRF